MDYKEQIDWLRRYCSSSSDIKIEQKIAILQQLQEQEQHLSQKEVMELAKRIRPLIRGTEDYVSVIPLSDDDFHLLPTPKERIYALEKFHQEGTRLFWAKNAPIHTQSYSFSNHLPECPANDLVEVGRITTYHRYGGYYGCLRPSVDEAIYQCPKEWLDKVSAFEIIAPSDQWREVYDNTLDRHVLTTVYYQTTVPEQVLAQEIEW